MENGLKEPKTRGNPRKQAKKAQNTGQGQDFLKKGRPQGVSGPILNYENRPQGISPKTRRALWFNFIRFLRDGLSPLKIIFPRGTLRIK